MYSKIPDISYHLVSFKVTTQELILWKISSGLTCGVLNQKAGGVSPGCLVPFKEVNGEKLTVWGVNLDISCGQRQDKHCSNKCQEQGQTVRERRG